VLREEIARRVAAESTGGGSAPPGRERR